MAKSKKTAKSEKTEAPEKQSPVDSIEVSEKSLSRLKLYGLVCLVPCLAMVAGSVSLVVRSSGLSMQAFEELPLYRTSRLQVSYNSAMKTFDESYNGTLTQVEGEDSKKVLVNAKSLPQLMVVGEQDFAATVAIYAEVTDIVASNAGSAREWNRHFQTKLKVLQTASAKRQSVLADIVKSFPEPDMSKEGEPSE